MAVSMIDAWPDWPGNLAVIVGPQGAGKSHIAAAWLSASDGRIFPVAAVKENLPELAELLKQGSNLVIEDVDPVRVPETNLFHLINTIRQEQRFCLFTSRERPSEWDVELPDLQSRLKTAQVVELQEPDELLLKQVMFKLFADRQLQVDERVVDYCILRMERSLQAAEKLVSAIDAEALAKKSGVTKILAGKVLERLSAD